MKVRLWRRGEDNGTGPAIQEAQAILSGRAVEWFEARSDRIPIWAWVNELAHASPARLRQLVTIGHYAHPASWDCALGAAAAEVVVAGSTPAGILRVQRDTLVPLELGLLAGTAAPPGKPAQLTGLIRTIIQERRAPQ